MSGGDLVPPLPQNYEGLAIRLGNNEAAVAALARDVREGREETGKALDAITAKLDSRGLTWPVLLAGVTALGGVLWGAIDLAKGPLDWRLASIEHAQEKMADSFMAKSEVEERFRVVDRRLDAGLSRDEKFVDALDHQRERFDARIAAAVEGRGAGRDNVGAKVEVQR